MKTAALEAQNTHLASTRGRIASDFAELVKARLTLLVLLTTAVGFYLGGRTARRLHRAFSRCLWNCGGCGGRSRA